MGMGWNGFEPWPRERERESASERAFVSMTTMEKDAVGLLAWRRIFPVGETWAVRR
jgi:hypothetical protein